MKIRWSPKKFAIDSWQKLRQLRDAPHAVAGGVAIGVFWGFTPFAGLKTLLSIFTAWLARCSKLPAVIAVALHDVLLPVWPIILRWEYQIGFWILSQPHHFPPPFKINHIRLAQFFDWKWLGLLWPTFIGSCIIGVPMAALTYLIVKWTLTHYEKRHQLQLVAPP